MPTGMSLPSFTSAATETFRQPGLRSTLPIGVAVLCLVVSGTAQTRDGVITGVARDLGGSVLPGVTVTAIAGEFQRKAVTGSNGRYRLDDLAAGTYRVQADLAGFRRTTAEGIIVAPGREIQHDLVMRIGILTRPDLLVEPAGGLSGALRAADAIVHLRLTRVVGVRLIGPSESWLTTEHVAVALSVLKGGAADLAPGASLHFWQPYAGAWVEDGRRLVGERPPYQVDDEFVGLFTRVQDAKLVESVAGRYMFRVLGGKVAWPHAPSSGVQDGMSVDAFIAALLQLLAGGQRGLS